MKQSLRVLNTVLALVALALPLWGYADSFPARTINLLVPYKAGGGVDSYARILAKASRHHDSLRFAVINKPGAGGLNGAVSLLKARPDGHTLMLVSGSSFLLSTMMRQSIVDPFDSFQFVAQIGQLNTSLMVPRRQSLHQRPGLARRYSPGRQAPALGPFRPWQLSLSERAGVAPGQ